MTQGATTYTHLYNGQGDRVRQSVNSAPTPYALDLNAGLTQVLTDTSNVYLYGPSTSSGQAGRIAQYAGANASYFLTDALGSVRQLTKNTGGVILAKNYQPYGTVMSSAGSGASMYGFTGEQTDSGTNLIYLRARYYTSGAGRFVTADSWGGDYQRPMSLNKWLYVYANPTNWTDPSGRDCTLNILTGQTACSGPQTLTINPFPFPLPSTEQITEQTIRDVAARHNIHPTLLMAMINAQGTLSPSSDQRHYEPLQMFDEMFFPFFACGSEIARIWLKASPFSRDPFPPSSYGPAQIRVHEIDEYARCPNGGASCSAAEKDTHSEWLSPYDLKNNLEFNLTIGARKLAEVDRLAASANIVLSPFDQIIAYSIAQNQGSRFMDAVIEQLGASPGSAVDWSSHLGKCNFLGGAAQSSGFFRNALQALAKAEPAKWPLPAGVDFDRWEKVLQTCQP